MIREALRNFRQRLVLRQVDAAALLGVSLSTWVKWESGRTKPRYEGWLRGELERIERERGGKGK